MWKIQRLHDLTDADVEQIIRNKDQLCEVLRHVSFTIVFMRDFGYVKEIVRNTYFHPDRSTHRKILIYIIGHYPEIMLREINTYLLSFRPTFKERVQEEEYKLSIESDKPRRTICSNYDATGKLMSIGDIVRFMHFRHFNLPKRTKGISKTIKRDVLTIYMLAQFDLGRISNFAHVLHHRLSVHTRRAKYSGVKEPLSLQQYARESIRSRTTCDGINELPLPKPLKLYLAYAEF